MCRSTRKPSSSIEWREAAELFATPPDHIKTSEGCRNLVPVPSHTASSETLVCTLRIVAKRASGAGFFWLITLLNLGQAPTSQHCLIHVKV